MIEDILIMLLAVQIAFLIAGLVLLALIKRDTDTMRREQEALRIVLEAIPPRRIPVITTSEHGDQ